MQRRSSVLWGNTRGVPSVQHTCATYMHESAYDMSDYNATCRTVMENAAPSPDVARFMSDLAQRIRNATDLNVRVANDLATIPRVHASTPLHTPMEPPGTFHLGLSTQDNGTMSSGVVALPSDRAGTTPLEQSPAPAPTSTLALRMPKWVFIAGVVASACVLAAVVTVVVLYSTRSKRNKSDNKRSSPPEIVTPAGSTGPANGDVDCGYSQRQLESRAHGNPALQGRGRDPSFGIPSVSTQPYRDASSPTVHTSAPNTTQDTAREAQQRAMYQQAAAVALARRQQMQANSSTMQVQVTNADALTPEQRAATMDALSMEPPGDEDDAGDDSGGDHHQEYSGDSSTYQEAPNRMSNNGPHDHSLGSADMSERGTQRPDPPIDSRMVAERVSGQTFNSEQMTEQRYRLPAPEETNVCGSARDIHPATMPLDLET